MVGFGLNLDYRAQFLLRVCVAWGEEGWIGVCSCVGMRGCVLEGWRRNTVWDAATSKELDRQKCVEL